MPLTTSLLEERGVADRRQIPRDEIHVATRHLEVEASRVVILFLHLQWVNRQRGSSQAERKPCGSRLAER